MLGFNKIKALKSAINLQDGSDPKYLLLLIALAEVVKLFTGEKADNKIDELLQKISSVWGLVDIFAKVKTEHDQLLLGSDEQC